MSRSTDFKQLIVARHYHVTLHRLQTIDCSKTIPCRTPFTFNRWFWQLCFIYMTLFGDVYFFLYFSECSQPGPYHYGAHYSGKYRLKATPHFPEIDSWWTPKCEISKFLVSVYLLFCVCVCGLCCCFKKKFIFIFISILGCPSAVNFGTV